MKLNERLENDSVFIKKFELSELRLLKDGELDWFLLIPHVEGCSEIYDLDETEQQILTKEINQVASIVKNHAQFDKLNIASIGNIVSQMHVHIIGRKKTDRAWPGTIWGTNSNLKLSEDRIDFWKMKFN